MRYRGISRKLIFGPGHPICHVLRSRSPSACKSVVNMGGTSSQPSTPPRRPRCSRAARTLRGNVTYAQRYSGRLLPYRMTSLPDTRHLLILWHLCQRNEHCLSTFGAEAVLMQSHVAKGRSRNQRSFRSLAVYIVDVQFYTKIATAPWQSVLDHMSTTPHATVPIPLACQDEASCRLKGYSVQPRHVR